MKVVFLDRDGTINRDPPDERVTRIAEVKLFPDTIEALSVLAKAGVNAGTKTILVKTGNKPVESTEATFTAENLLQAVDYIIKN